MIWGSPYFRKPQYTHLYIVFSMTRILPEFPQLQSPSPLRDPPPPPFLLATNESGHLFVRLSDPGLAGGPPSRMGFGGVFNGFLTGLLGCEWDMTFGYEWDVNMRQNHGKSFFLKICKSTMNGHFSIANCQITRSYPT